MSWAKRGYDETENFDSGGGGGGDNRREDGEWPVRRFFVKPEMTRRIMFLDDDPFQFWEHSLGSFTNDWSVHAPCLKRNKIDDRGCPVCDAAEDMDGGKGGWPPWASFTGYYSIVDMGDVMEDEAGNTVLQGYYSAKSDKTFQFGRRLFGVKRGSQTKPGILVKLKRLSKKRGGLAGTVWDVYRTGKQAAGSGDEFEFIEKIDLANAESYLLGLGADKEQLELEIVDYEKEFTPMPYERLARIAGRDTGAREPQGHAPPPSRQQSANPSAPKPKARTEGAHFGGGIDDIEDVPF